MLECWQGDPESRPDIRDVKTRLIGMISGTNMLFNIADNDQQQVNEDNSSPSHCNTILQKEFDEAVKNYEVYAKMKILSTIMINVLKRDFSS